MMQITRNKKKTKKVGRKSQWDKEITNDLIENILDDDKLKEKLLLTNVKNVKNSEHYVINELTERCKQRTLSD